MADAQRPAGVTVVAVLAMIIGALQIIGGIAQIAGLGSPSPGSLLWLGVFYLIVGVATVVVGVGLLRGSRIARVVATIVFAIGLITDIVAIVSTPGQAWVGIVAAVFRVILLILLYTRSANAFFSR